MANIIIPGANQGIGYYFTEQALKDGNKVAVLDVETDKLEALAQAFPKQLLYYNTDVCDEIQINSAVKEIIAAFLFIYIAIHNACLCTFDNECSIDLDIYKQVFNVSGELVTPQNTAVMPRPAAKDGARPKNPP